VRFVGRGEELAALAAAYAAAAGERDPDPEVRRQ
jgi:hypothetical protein